MYHAILLKCEELSPFVLDTSNVDIQAHSPFAIFKFYLLS